MDSVESFVKKHLAKYGMYEIEALIENLSREEHGNSKEKLKNLYMDLENIFRNERFMKEYEEILIDMLKGEVNRVEKGKERIENIKLEPRDIKVEYLPPKKIDWDKLAENGLESESEIVKVIEKVKRGEIEKNVLIPDLSNEVTNGRNVCFVTELESIPKSIENYIYKHGIKKLREGKVGIIIMSGGDGSRLGYNGPKGMYPIGKISKDSFFKIFCQKIQSLTRLVFSSDCNTEKIKYLGELKEIPLYVMTSDNNDHLTKNYFKENNNFGLENVIFFKQDSVPSINIKNNCSFFLSEDLKILKSPNGNGGIFDCMKNQGIINDMYNKGIEYVFIHCIDNPLCKICDPFFIGYSDLLNLQISTKTINKKDVNENIGSVAQKVSVDINVTNILPCIIEYTELNKLGNKKDDFSFGSIGIHLFHLDFIKEISSKILEFPYHIAYKKIPYLKYLNDNKTPNLKPYIDQPSEVNGIKLETFIFDSFAFTNTPVHCINVSRDEFSPVKSASGQNSPDSCQISISNLNKKLLNRALNISDNFSKDFLFPPSKYLEISPLVSYDGENLDKFSQLITTNNHNFIYINDSSQIVFLDDLQ
ncbi:UDP-N-acetylglucosamine pyrophosphorylase [Cryptosporidium ubiquitum]|uniref:UDP-N-acetylglucosamine diphosphorylase n=1 Tax=Cryptosporidium ubiquitum TaxID=857276 RepID=A0A1J4MDI1_9CRYT|nr:UDP-N-acetylglucosamine pyrophosphorylase [Cryptosporidium ubiquitum]OII72288.1 UDP-N-acetylglucosamine pyrophosphorylase [Cryptosporidium ubiquitum]